jgi:hypothetical protein
LMVILKLYILKMIEDPLPLYQKLYLLIQSNKMKKEQLQTPDPSSSLHKTENPEKEFMFVIPPGIKFNDIYMDVSDIRRELGYQPRTIYNMRAEGKLSYTTLNDGKPLFFRQEPAAIL